MQAATIIADIKKGLEPYLGCRIRLRANKGRRKYIEREGVLESVYPNIFVIKLDESQNRRVSFNYTDILTQTIQLQVLRSEQPQVEPGFAT